LLGKSIEQLKCLAAEIVIKWFCTELSTIAGDIAAGAAIILFRQKVARLRRSGLDTAGRKGASNQRFEQLRHVGHDLQ
jgi:signal recognition particle GTPase